VRLAGFRLPVAGIPNHGDAPSSWFQPRQCSIVVVGHDRELVDPEEGAGQGDQVQHPDQACEVLGCQPGDLMSWRQE
jgi:hypothetical protein